MYKAVFESIYLRDVWNGSGVGSSPGFCAPWCDFMEKFIVENRIRSVIDIGCGYREYSEYKDWASELDEYHGIDVVAFPIQGCLQRFVHRKNYHFTVGDGFQVAGIEKYDMVLVKDVLNHLPLDDVVKALGKLGSHQCVMLVHDYIPNLPNSEIVVGDSRPIDPSQFRCGRYELKMFWNGKGVWLKVLLGGGGKIDMRPLNAVCEGYSSASGAEEAEA